jgi:hypothetical protein
MDGRVCLKSPRLLDNLVDFLYRAQRKFEGDVGVEFTDSLCALVLREFSELPTDVTSGPEPFKAVDVAISEFIGDHHDFGRERA